MPVTTKKSPISAPRPVNNNIFIKGARVHNLKNIDVEIPRNKLVVVTGVSGSGKSSLTIDTLFAEGQRRYAESLSAYARQFMARMVKPDVDFIKGLCPAIAIEQKVITRTPRSTVGSMTEIYDYLRLLYARVGITISPVSGRVVKKEDVQDVINAIKKFKAGDKVMVLVPFLQHKNRQSVEELNILLQKGFSRLYEKEVLPIEDLLENKKWKPGPKTYILIDRLVVKEFDEDDMHRMADSIGTAFYEGEGEMTIEVKNLVELEEVLNIGKINRIMFDNFEIPLMEEAVQIVSGKFQTEASGGVNLNTVRRIAQTGVDYISIGSLTHSAIALDMSLKIEKGS